MHSLKTQFETKLDIIWFREKNKWENGNNGSETEKQISAKLFMDESVNLILLI